MSNKVDIERLINQLGEPFHGYYSDEINDFKTRLIPILQKYSESVIEFISGSRQGPKEAARCFILIRILNDLITALHLVFHYHYNQAATIIKSLLEGIKLLQAIEISDSVLDSWHQSKNLNNLKVRNLNTIIGQKSDSFYGYICVIGTHHRFTGLKSYVARAKKKKDGRLAIVAKLGPYTENGQGILSIYGDRFMLHIGIVFLTALDLIIVTSKLYTNRVINQNAELKSEIEYFKDKYVQGKYLENHKEFMQKFSEIETKLIK